MTDAISHVLDHVEQGTGLFLDQFRNKPRLYAWAKAYLRQVQLLEDAAWGVVLDRFIDNAENEQLDIIGKLIGELRHDRDDATYKIFINARIRINRSKGSTKDVLDVLNIITTTPLFFNEYEPACFYIELKQIADEDVVLLYGQLNDTKAAGVKLTLVAPTSNTIDFETAGYAASSVSAHAMGDAASVKGGETGSITITPTTFHDAAATFSSGLVGAHLVIGGATGANNGRFLITGYVDAHTIHYTNAAAFVDPDNGNVGYFVELAAARSFGLMGDAVTIRDPGAPPVEAPAGPPTVLRAAPDHANQLDYTAVTLFGTGFKGAGFETGPSAVHVGPTNGATNVGSLAIVSSSEMTFVMPPRLLAGNQERATVWVTTPFGTGNRTAVFHFELPPVFSVSSISPTSGTHRGGTTITITGEQLSDVVYGWMDLFGDLTAFLSFTVVSSEEITAVVPPGTAFAPYGIRLQLSTGEQFLFKCNNATDYAWAYTPEPTIFLTAPLVPDHGSWKGGFTVAFTGGGFTSTTPGLTGIEYRELSSVASSVSTDTSGTFVASDVATSGYGPYDGGPVDVWFNASGPVASLPLLVEPLQITSASPSIASVSGGATITIGGTSLDTLSEIHVMDDTNAADHDVTTSMVLIDQNTASFVFPVLPANCVACRIRIVGTDPGGGGTSGMAEGDTNAFWTSYRYLFELNYPVNPGPAPAMPTSCSPSTGSHTGSTVVTCLVPSSAGITALLFDGVAGTSFSIVDATHVRATTVAHAAGAVRVNTVNTYGTSPPLAMGFTYT